MASEACATIGAAPETSRPVPLTTRWEGYLQKRSDWLKQWEAFYFVLHGCALYCYLSADEARRSPESSKIKHGAFSFSSHAVLQHVVSINALADHDFIVETTAGKPLFLRAKTEAAKQLWMHMTACGIADTTIDSRGRVQLRGPPRQATVADVYLGYEYLWASLSALEDEAREKVVALKGAPRHVVQPSTPVTPAVDAPPIDHPLARLVSMCRPDVALRTNYHAAVPFQGAYSGLPGLLEYLTKLTRSVVLLTFAVNDLRVDGGVAVATGHESMQVRATGKVLRQDWRHKLHLHPVDGRIVRWEVHGDVDASTLAFKGSVATGSGAQRDSLSTIKLDHLPSFDPQPSWQMHAFDTPSPDDVAQVPRRPRAESPPAASTPPLHSPYVEPGMITMSSPLQAPLHFKRGNLWPDPPLLPAGSVRLARTQQLDLTRPRDDLELYVNLACKTLRCAAGAVVIFGATSGFFVAKQGIQGDAVPMEMLLEAHVGTESLVVLETTADVRFAANPLVADVQFFVGVPLRTADNVLLGALSVRDVAPRGSVREADLAALLQIAQTIMNRVEDIQADVRRSAPTYHTRGPKPPGPARRSYEQQRAIDLDID
ncbi:serine/threonine protein kinase [Achlya hypogyna]|uniref:Serine/threonine protein kinase n=1 Tax=Achlya hypogyna TaxID=1202772 RepID=A0A1V9Z469_ACHHY|nr:serine/threonine protein kinase [Achlya hypogyna]